MYYNIERNKHDVITFINYLNFLNFARLEVSLVFEQFCTVQRVVSQSIQRGKEVPWNELLRI